MTQKLGILGGTFNPVHHGHLILAQDALEHFGLDRVLFIPSAQPPHKRSEKLATAEHRLAMLRAAIGDDPCFEVSTIELERQGPSYTIETIKALRATRPEAMLHFIIGTDSLLELHQWYQIGELLGLCEFVTMLRPGFPVEHLTEERLNLPASWAAVWCRICSPATPRHLFDGHPPAGRRRTEHPLSWYPPPWPAILPPKDFTANEHTRRAHACPNGTPGLLDKKAANPVLLDVRAVSSVTDFYLIATAPARRISRRSPRKWSTNCARLASAPAAQRRIGERLDGAGTVASWSSISFCRTPRLLRARRTLERRPRVE